MLRYLSSIEDQTNTHNYNQVMILIIKEIGLVVKLKNNILGEVSQK